MASTVEGNRMSIAFNYSDLLAVSPILFLSLYALVLLVLDAAVKRSGNLAHWLTIFALIVTGFLTINTFTASHYAFNGMVFTGTFPAFFEIVFVISAILSILLSKSYLERLHINRGEYYSLLVFATIGMMVMASARDLMVLFIGLELMSMSLYVLAGYVRHDPKSNEASLKYFLLGAFATGFLLYGISLVYGASGTTNLAQILDNFPTVSANPLLWIGSALILIGLSFKISAVPFHMWVPDVYEGSPTTVAGFMSTGSKAAAFSALVLVFSYSVHPNWQLQQVIAYLAALTMILGNLIALVQQNIKRMLAYSSIAHAGYALVGIAAANALGRTGVLYYMLAYTFMQIGAFGVVSVLERKDGKYLSLTDYEGLAKSHPVIAALMAIFMFSLAGIPPFAGFFGKYYLFASAVSANLTWLAIVGVLASVVSVYFYVGVVVNMYFKEEPDAVGEAAPSAPMIISKVGGLALVIAAIAVIELGLTPGYIVALTSKLF